PSSVMLAALAEAVGREPEWLRFGIASQATARIGALIRDCRRAVQDDDTEQVENCLRDLLDRDLGRPLTREELDLSLFFKAYVLSHRGKDGDAVALLEPLVARLLHGECGLAPVALGQKYLGAAYFGFQQGDVALEVLSEASARTRRILATVRPDHRDDDWWRLAATATSADYSVCGPAAALAQGSSWLAELEELDAGRAPSGVAALRWNIGLYLAELGRPGEGLAHLSVAVRLHDVERYPCDGARLRMEYAMIWMMSCPEAVEQAITVLESTLPDLERHAYPSDLWEWRIIRARAEIVAGRTESVPALVSPILAASDDDLMTRATTWMILGDARALRDEVGDAGEAYDRAASFLSRSSRRWGRSRHWRDLGDRYLRLGFRDRAVTAYDRALTIADLPAFPGVPPLRV
ncbi:MAG: hypothetical protein QG622_1693, partial [Actinomycetota bacterium]|nr:hypothetical protein [Actinomycetota bacterium]